MATLNGAKYAALAALTGQTGSLDDLEYAWLIDATASEGPSHINDLWLLALEQNGYTEGSFGDRMFDFLVAEGYTGSLNDMLYAWWLAGGGFGGVTEVVTHLAVPVTNGGIEVTNTV
jgi:hypothetical protein